MEGIRLIRRVLYDTRKHRFQSTAFRNSSDFSGISIVSRECVCATGGRTCSHVRKYYGPVAGEPVIFWMFSTDIFPSCCRLVQQTSETGDICHYNLVGLSQGDAKQIFRAHTSNLQEMWICEGDCFRPLERSDLDN